MVKKDREDDKNFMWDIDRYTSEGLAGGTVHRSQIDQKTEVIPETPPKDSKRRKNK